MPQVIAGRNYGPVRKGQPYTVLDNGIDWIKISVNGRAVYVPNTIEEPNPHDNSDDSGTS